MAKLMCNVYLWCDYFIWLAVHLNFILCATIPYRHLVCNRHQDYCYCWGPLRLTPPMSRCLPQLLWNSFVLIKQFRFSCHSVPSFRFVCAPNVRRLLQFSVLCWYFLCFARNDLILIPLSISFQMLSISTLLTQKWTRRLTTVSMVCLCAFSLSLVAPKQISFELNDWKPLELCLNNLFGKIIFLRPFVLLFSCILQRPPMSDRQLREIFRFSESSLSRDIHLEGERALLCHFL